METNKPNKIRFSAYFFAIFFFVIMIGCKESKIEKLKKQIDKTTMVVLNEHYVLLDPTDFLNKIDKKSILDTETKPIDELEYNNDFKSVISLKTDSSVQKIFNNTKWIEYQFFKKVNPNKKPLYMVDGMPVHDYNTVVDYLPNRKIKKINKIPSNQAEAIWGKREGKNGAIQIWTVEREGETVIPVIIK